MATVRYTWMFRAVAMLFMFFGAAWLWRFGLTDYHPEQRPFGLAAGVLALLLGVFLFRRKRFAIGASAIASTIVGLSAAVFAPNARGPVILFLAGLAIACVVYAVLCFRVLTQAAQQDATP
jgi:peptidoglycan/LPS O-acetylase OafA/YrhL